HRRRLIDSFVNSIYLFDDRLIITFNYKHGTKAISFDEIKDSLGSDLYLFTAPKRNGHQLVSVSLW
ncbi:MAG: recombinase, partial [Clostridia bacterium]|nr:recombinase [Clostridia bacterium]